MSKLSVQEEVIIQNLSARFNDLSGGVVPKKNKITKSAVSTKQQSLKLGVVDVPKTLAKRGKANVRAMELAIGFETPTLTKDQLKEIKKYTGWGGFSLEDLPENRKKESYHYWIDLYNQKTGQEMPYDDMATTYEYYTPYWLTQNIKDLLKPLEKFYQKNSDNKIVGFETSAGVGRFIEPFDNDNFKFHAIEPSGSAHEILRRSYPQAKTYNETFERFITSPKGQELISSASLVLSNPPYGARDGQEMVLDRGYEKYDNLVSYFIARSMSLLHENGIGVFLVPSSFMDGGQFKSARENVIKSNHLLGAIRLPSTKIVPKKSGDGTTKKPAIFEGVSLIVDLIFLQRRKGELKTTKSVHNNFIEGNYFVDNRDKVIGQYGRSSFNRTELVIEGNLQKLPNITFSPMKKYKDNSYRQFQSSGGQTMVAQGINDTSRLSPEVRSAIRFGKLGSEFLTQLENDKSKALLIQGEAKKSYEIFKSIYKKEADVLKLIRELTNSGFSTEANQIASANSQNKKIFTKVEFKLNLTESQKSNPIELAKQLLIFNRQTKNQDYVWAKNLFRLYKGSKSKGYKSKILSLISKDKNYGLLSGTIDPKTKKFSPCKDDQLAIFEGKSFYSGLLWPNYDASIATLELLKEQKVSPNTLTVIDEQIKALSDELGLIQPSFLIANQKATPQDIWIPIDTINKWFKTVYHDNDEPARTYNTEGRNDNFSKHYLTPDEYHLIRTDNNALALETLSSDIFDSQAGWRSSGKYIFDGRFIESKIDYLYKLQVIFKDLKTWINALGINLDEYRKKIDEVSKEIDFAINEFNKDAFDKDGATKSGYSKMREDLGLSAQRLYFRAKYAINPLFVLLKEKAEKGEFLSGFTLEKYREFVREFYNPYKTFIIPVHDIKSGEIFKKQTEVMGWMIGDKRLFSPKFTDHGQKWKYNTKLNASENPDDARLRLDKKWLRLWTKWLKSNFEEVEILTEIYNRNFKGYKKPELNGSPIDIVGINKEISLRPYQNTAVRKIVIDNGGLLALDVGLGKTFSGIATIGLMKQQGKAKKPIIVVPKSIVWKWVADINTLFPDWNVGVIGSTKKYYKSGRVTYPTDSPQERGLKYLKFTQGVYDVLVVPYEKLMTTPISKPTFDNYLRKVVRITVNAMPEQKGSAKARARKRRKAVAKVVSKISLSSNIKLDEGIVWDDLKIDFLMVDEAQNFKNLYTPQLTFSESINYLGVGRPSTRAFQLDMRCEEVRSRNGAIVLLSATPAKNSPIEFWNLIQYVAPEAFLHLPTPRHFMVRYINISSKLLPTTSISTKVQTFVDGFKNLDEFRDLLSRYTMFETLETIMEKYGAEYPDLKKKLKIPEVVSEQVIIEPLKDQDLEMQEIIDAGDEETAEGTKYWPLIEARNKARKEKFSGVGQVEVKDIDKLQGMEVLLRLNAVAIHPILNKIATSDKEEKKSESSDEKVSKEEKIQIAKQFLNEKPEEDWDAILNNKKFATKLITEKIVKHLSTKDITIDKLFEDYSLTEIQKAIKEYEKWEKRDRKSEYRKITQDLKKAGKLSYPKLVACAENVMTDIAEGGCGHIIFVANVLAHYMMKEVLIEKGVKQDRIAILSGIETPKSEQRQEVATKFNGDIPNGVQPDYDVVIANQVAYEGIDLQKRTCMIHHLDLGWESATMQQRNGRGVRQGNAYTVIKIYYYILSKSADIYRMNTIQNKRNWLVQAVESQDISTNNTLADSDEGLDEILITTLRDPTQYAEQFEAMKAIVAKQKLIDFRIRCADRLSNLADGFKLAKYFTSKGLTQKAVTQFNDTEKELEEFKSEVDVNEYPFAVLADMTKTKTIYVPENSPIGAVYFSDMIYNITFPTNSENNSASGYFVHITNIKENRGSKEVSLDIYYGSKDRWESTETYKGERFESYYDSIAEDLNTLLVTNDVMIRQFQAYLRSYYPNNESAENKKLMSDPEELSKLLFKNNFLNLDQNQKVKNKMMFESTNWKTSNKDTTIYKWLKENKLKKTELKTIVLLQKLYEEAEDEYFTKTISELRSKIVNDVTKKIQNQLVEYITNIVENMDIMIAENPVEGFLYARSSKYKDVLKFYTDTGEDADMYKIKAIKKIGSKNKIEKALKLIKELSEAEVIFEKRYSAVDIDRVTVPDGKIQFLGTNIFRQKENWEGEIFINKLKDITKFNILSNIRTQINRDAIDPYNDIPTSTLKLISKSKETNIRNAVIVSSLLQRDRYYNRTLLIPVINKANGLLYFMSKKDYSGTQARPFLDNATFIKSLMKMGDLYAGATKVEGTKQSYLTVKFIPDVREGIPNKDYLWFRLLETDTLEISKNDVKLYQELSDKIAKQNRYELIEVKIFQYHEILRNRTLETKRKLKDYEFVKYNRSKKMNLDFQGAIQAVYQKEVTVQTASEDDLFGDTQEDAEVIRTDTQNEIGIPFVISPIPPTKDGLELVKKMLRDNKMGGVLSRRLATSGALKLDSFQNGFSSEERKMWTTTKEFVSNGIFTWNNLAITASRYFRITLSQEDKDDFLTNFVDKQ